MCHTVNELTEPVALPRVNRHVVRAAKRVECRNTHACPSARTHHARDLRECPAIIRHIKVVDDVEAENPIKRAVGEGQV
jgi:hypothetical protein